MVNNYRKGWNDIFGKKKKSVKSVKIDDGYGEKPYEELEVTEVEEEPTE